MKHLCLSAIMAAFCLPHIALADTTRGCNAEYRIKVTHADGRPVSRNEVGFGRFTARGRCRGKAWANDCRRAARSYALGCTQAHWIYRFDRKAPGQCGNGGSTGTQDYRVQDLKANIEWHACFGGAAPGFRDEVIVRVRAVSWGDKRCGGEAQLTGSYRVTGSMCAAVDSKAEVPPN